MAGCRLKTAGFTIERAARGGIGSDRVVVGVFLAFVWCAQNPIGWTRQRSTRYYGSVEIHLAMAPWCEFCRD